MAQLILFDDPAIRTALLPLTFTRPVAGLRVGISTLSEKWAAAAGQTPSFLTQDYLQPTFPHHAAADNLYVNGAICPTDDFCQVLRELPMHNGLHDAQGRILAVRAAQPLAQAPEAADGYTWHFFPHQLPIIESRCAIFEQTYTQIQVDFDRLTANRTSAPITDPFTRYYAPEHIFLEPGATVKAAILNAEKGPIYIGRNATVHEGSIIIGPFALGEESAVTYGGRMRPGTSIGPHCRVGGEVSNSVFQAYSNKGHDGYLGNSIIGAWCNLGAAVNTSNLKNDYSTIKTYDYATKQLEDTGRMFCGLIMGDFSRAGINTMFNTGTVVGVNVNVFGGGFQYKHIPSFSWGGASDGFATYRLEKALTVASQVFTRRGCDFDEKVAAMLHTIFDITRASLVPRSMPF